MEILEKRTVGLYTLEYKSNGILYVHISDEFPESVEGQNEAVLVVNELVNNKKVPMLYQFDEFALPNEACRENWAKLETNPNSMADAYIVNTLALKLIANFFMKINKPRKPTKFFQTEMEAIEWLSTFLEEMNPGTLVPVHKGHSSSK